MILTEIFDLGIYVTGPAYGILIGRINSDDILNQQVPKNYLKFTVFLSNFNGRLKIKQKLTLNRITE